MIMVNRSCNCGFGPVAAKPYYPCGVREVMTRNKRFIRYFSVAVIKHCGPKFLIKVFISTAGSRGIRLHESGEAWQ